MGRQPRTEGGKRISRFEHGHDSCDIIKGSRRTDLAAQAAAHLFVVCCGAEGLIHPRHGAVLETVGKLLCTCDLAAIEGSCYFPGDGFHLAGHQVAAHPFPDRLERHARNPTGMVACHDIVDQEWLKRLKEESCEIARTFCGRIVACLTPQFLQHQFRTRHVFAAQQAAL